MGLDSFYGKNPDIKWTRKKESQDNLPGDGNISLAGEKINNLKGTTPRKTLTEIEEECRRLLAEFDELLKEEPKEQNVSTQDGSDAGKINGQESFLEGLNKCPTKDIEKIQQYVDGIVDNLLKQQTIKKHIGAKRGIKLAGQGNIYEDNGYYDQFISPETQILNDTLGSGYHIYDRDYLYQFAKGIRSLNLNKDADVLQHIMPFLDNYFGIPKDQVDRREDTFWKVCEPKAEEFYKKKGVTYDLFDSAISYMQYKGEFPLSALKGKNVAQCVERSCLAQNILKMCGFESSINFGEAESRGKAEGHAWNIIRYKDGYLLIDFNNTAHVIENGKVVGRKPFSFNLSTQAFEEYKAGKKNLISRDFHYEKGKKVFEAGNRIYSVGRSIDKTSYIKPDNEGISRDDFRVAAENPESIEARREVLDDLTNTQAISQEPRKEEEQGDIDGH